MRRRPLKRQRSRFPRILFAALSVSVMLGYLTSTVFAANITVNGSIVYDKSHLIASRSELPPSQCPAVTQIRNLSDGWTYGASNAGQLWLGNAGQGSTINAGKNGDCIVPGGVANGTGTDLFINGGNGGGNDVCFDGPGPGTYSRTSCNSTPSWSGGYISNPTNSPAFS
jgi:hypothetical protein